MVDAVVEALADSYECKNYGEISCVFHPPHYKKSGRKDFVLRRLFLGTLRHLWRWG